VKLSNPRVAPGDRERSTLERGIERLQGFLRLVPFLNGNLVTGIVFAAGVAKTIDHGLGRPVRGYIVVRNYGTNVANFVGEQPLAQPSDPSKQINLITTLASTMDVWFF